MAAWLTEPVSDEAQSESSRAEPPSDTITCVDCGGVAHLITPAREDQLWFVGDIVAYRCGDCRDRWDLGLEEHHPRG
jgi:hypothetical protein